MTEKKYNLTEIGEAKAVDVIGGQDVVNVVSAFIHIIKTRGNLLSNTGYEPDIKTFMEFARIVQLIKLYGTWDVLIQECEKLLEQETDYFTKEPHSL